MEPFIYVDTCHEEMERKIFYELGIPLVRRMKESQWSVNEMMSIATDPRLKLAVLNKIDDIAIMEVALLHFMCKPTLITHQAIEAYPALERAVDYIDYASNLKDASSQFIKWYSWWENR